MNRNKVFLIFIILGLGLLAAVFLALITGGATISLSMVIDALIHPQKAGIAHTILWRLRIPRAIMGITVGAGLAGCGVIFQAILRNPLAEPYTLGVSGGGALGAAISICLGISGFPMVGMCFAGCCSSMILVYGISSIKNFSNTVLILSGVILSFLFSSTVMLIFALARTRDVHNTIMWLMGNLSPINTTLINITALIVVPLLVILIPFGRDLNLLSLGEEKALHLGLDAQKAKVFFFIIASIITGACVAVSGIISFVGLIIPHFVRRAIGPNHQVLLPASMLAGAIFLLLCDIFAQVIIRPLELPVGVITGIAGALFFIGFLINSKDWEIM
ncbi:MAG: iron ABC transporter permease [Thermodesulfobacteriota bacterium]|nr:iron ABC transporter permease [Thermodesulfobacteriota bacterium]